MLRKKRFWFLVLVVLVIVGFLAKQFLVPKIIRLPDLTGTLKEVQTTHNQRDRRYLIYRPEALQAGAALVIVFHGSMSTAEMVREMSARQFDRLADEKGFLLIYPQGYKHHWNDCRGTADYAANTENIDDVGFVRQIIGEASKAYGIDTHRVYVAGHSNGGQMALRMALEAPEDIAAAASMSGNLPMPESLDCVMSGKPVNFALITGTDDPINPYQGGLVKILWDESRGYVRSAYETVQYFASLAQYRRAPVESSITDRVKDDSGRITVKKWYGHAYRVSLYTMEGGGHIMPSVNSDFGLIGGSIRDVDAADLLWAFFTGAQEDAGLRLQ